MSLRTTLNNGYIIVKSSWVKETIYLLTFGLLMSIILLPFAFLVAIASVGLEDDVNSAWDLGLFFWVSVSLLFYVSNLFLLMTIGMIQKIGEDKTKGKLMDIEELVKYPFQAGRFSAFLVLGLITSVILGVIGGIVVGIGDLLNITTNDPVWDDWVWSIIQIAIFLIITPPIIMACHHIIKDQSRYDAFTISWKRYLRRFRDLSLLNILAIIPVALVIALISFIGIAIDRVGEGETARELFYILSLSFVIIIVSFFMVFIALPYYFITLGNGEEDTATTAG